MKEKVTMERICKINLIKYNFRKEDCLNAVRDFYLQTGQNSVKSYVSWAMRNNKPCTSIICEAFGSWNRAIEEAGIRK